MTPEQKAEIALLARVVMGWREVEPPEQSAADSFVIVHGGIIHAGAYWDPYTNPADAIGMLDKFLQGELRWNNGVQMVAVKAKHFEPWAVGSDRNRCYAICTACLAWARAQERGGK